MFRFTLVLALFGVIAFASACKKEKPADAPPVEATAPPLEATPPPPVEATAPPPPTEAPAADAGGSMANNMANCPSAVAGAKTVVTKEADKVVVTITGSDEAATAEIRKRAKLLGGFDGTDTTEVKHTKEGTGGGLLGKCPVALAEADAKAEDVDGGAKVTLTPKDPAKLEDLFKLVNERANAAPPAGGGAEGGGGGGHGGHGSGGGGGDHGGAGGGKNAGDAKEETKGTKEPKGGGW